MDMISKLKQLKLERQNALNQSEISKKIACLMKYEFCTSQYSSKEQEYIHTAKCGRFQLFVKENTGSVYFKQDYQKNIEEKVAHIKKNQEYYHVEAVPNNVLQKEEVYCQLNHSFSFLKKFDETFKEFKKEHLYEKIEKIEQDKKIKPAYKDKTTKLGNGREI